MNAFLANWLGRINALIAGVLVIGGAVLGASGGGAAGGEGGAFAGLIFGGVVGALVAVLFCGLLALLIAIRDELTAMRRALEGSSAGSGRNAP